MSVVILQDEIVHYEVLGRGRPLIFLHGWIGSWRYWIPAMQAASISFRTYAIDLWGFGDTAKVANFYSLDHQISLLEQFMQALGIEKVAVIGHGLGAIVAMLYAHRRNQSVDRLMAISIPNGRNTLNPRMYTASPEELADWLLSRSVDSDAARSEVPKADQRAIQYSLSNLQKIDVLSLSANLITPCLLVFGGNDPVFEANSTQEQAPNLPDHLHKIVFEGSGHFPMLDEPRKFNRLVADFLSLDSGVSPRELQLKEEWKRRVR